MVAGETKRSDTIKGETTGDTGITSGFLGPLINYTLTDSLNAEPGKDFPVSIDNSALQIVPDYRVRAAVIWHS